MFTFETVVEADFIDPNIFGKLIENDSISNIIYQRTTRGAHEPCWRSGQRASLIISRSWARTPDTAHFFPLLSPLRETERICINYNHSLSTNIGRPMSSVQTTDCGNDCPQKTITILLNLSSTSLAVNYLEIK